MSLKSSWRSICSSMSGIQLLGRTMHHYHTKILVPVGYSACSLHVTLLKLSSQWCLSSSGKKWRHYGNGTINVWYHHTIQTLLFVLPFSQRSYLPYSCVHPSDTRSGYGTFVCVIISLYIICEITYNLAFLIVMSIREAGEWCQNCPRHCLWMMRVLPNTSWSTKMLRCQSQPVDWSCKTCGYSHQWHANWLTFKKTPIS